MVGRTRVLTRANGAPAARILFVAEAPGRLGADRSGVPLSGDRTGRNFAALLQAAGLSRADIFVTNAVLCNPRDSRGNNAPPSMQELRNCSRHLAATIAVIAPGYVVALGVTALKALALVHPHEVVLSRDVGRAVEWQGRVLVPLYHPGKEQATRMELRCPDPSCNPYLTFAILLSAGLEGIEKGYELPEPMEKNLYHLSPDDRKRLGIEQLPETLGEAIEITAESELVLRTFGEHIFNRFVEIKRQEWEDYRVQVTPWELERYLSIL
jgi:uracil-DNA glycosylase family 4